MRHRQILIPTLQAVADVRATAIPQSRAVVILGERCPAILHFFRQTAIVACVDSSLQASEAILRKPTRQTRRNRRHETYSVGCWPGPAAHHSARSLPTAGMLHPGCRGSDDSLSEAITPQANSDAAFRSPSWSADFSASEALPRYLLRPDDRLHDAWRIARLPTNAPGRLIVSTGSIVLCPGVVKTKPKAGI